MHLRAQSYSFHVQILLSKTGKPRKHRHILKTTRSLLLSASVLGIFWGEAAFTSVYLINRIPTSSNGGYSPYEKLFGVKPDYTELKVFGCACFVLLSKRERNKLTARSTLCVFLGYGIEQKGYICYDPVAKRLRICRHVSFMEHIPFYQLPSATSSVKENEFILDSFSKTSFLPNFDSTRISSNDSPLSPSDAQNLEDPPDASYNFLNLVDAQESQESPLNESPTLPEFDSPYDDVSQPQTDNQPRYPSRPRNAPASLKDYKTCFSSMYQSFLTCVHSLHEPLSYKEAASDPNWQLAMNEELDSLVKTHTWDLVSLSCGKEPIGCKRVYKIKTNLMGL